MSCYCFRRRTERQHQAIERQRSYDTYVNDLLLGSSKDIAEQKFVALSPSQRQRVLSDPAFAHLPWLANYRKVPQ